MSINFQVTGIPEQDVQHLLEMDKSEMKKLGIQEVIADAQPGYPCRLSLQDAEIGEELFLFPYEHHPVNSPYRSSGPIYIRKHAREIHLEDNELPHMLHHRLLSLRVYDKDAMMIQANTVEGKFLKEQIQSIFSNENAHYIQVHNASPGCYNCQINRVA